MSQELILPIVSPRILGFQTLLGITVKTPPLQRKREVGLVLKTRVGIPKEIELEGNVPQHVLLGVLQSRRRLDIDQKLTKMIDDLKDNLLNKLGTEKIKGDKTRELMKILASFLAADQKV